MSLSAMPVAAAELWAAIDLDAVLQITDPDEGSWQTTVGQFVDDNCDDDETCAAALALLPGEPVLLTWGIEIERLAEPPAGFEPA